MIGRLKDADKSEVDDGLASTRMRVVRVTGLLLDLPLRSEADVGVTLRELLSSRSGAGKHDAR
jgi:hypothetical protein